MTILDAASLAGISFPYSCRTGRCSTCKALVERGQTRPLTDEVGLSAEELRAGWILTCVRVALADVVLDIEDLGAVQLPQPRTWPCRIAELERLAPDVLRVKLRLPPTSAFFFIPGQYVVVIGTNGTRRSYSVANAGGLDKLLELHVRAVKGGLMSDYWFNHAKLNDLLRLHGPMGTFFLRDCARIDVFFLATGTGIAPVKSMLESLTHISKDRQPNSVTVIWGGRCSEDFYIDIPAIPGNHRFIPVVSRPSRGWIGARGYVQDFFLAKTLDLSKAAVYACGSSNMIHSAKQVLSNSGLSPARFYADPFVSSSNV